MTTTFISHGGTGKRTSFPTSLMADDKLRLWFDRGGQDMLFAVDESAPWLLRIAWTYVDGKAEPTEVEIRGRDGQAVTPVVWRSVPLGKLVEESRFLLVGMAELAEHLFESRGHVEAAKAAGRASDAALGTRRGRPADYGPSHYERVAEAYVAAIAKGSRTPVKYVAEALTMDPAFIAEFTSAMKPKDRAAFLEDPRLTAKGDHRVKGWINRAKKMGLIPGERKEGNG
jgi:hypothetical protein